MKANFTNL